MSEGRGAALRTHVLLVLGSLASVSSAIGVCNCLLHLPVLMSTRITRRGKRLPPAHDSLADGFHFIKLIPGGGIAHVRDLQMWWLSQCVSMLGYWGEGGCQIATLGSLKSGEELQGLSFFQTMENSATSVFHNTACRWARQSVSHFVEFWTGYDRCQKNLWKSSKLLEEWMSSLPMVSGVAVLVGAVQIVSQRRRFTIIAIQMIDSSITSQVKKSGWKEVHEWLFFLHKEIHINQFIINWYTWFLVGKNGTISFGRFLCVHFSLTFRYTSKWNVALK